MKTHKFSFYFVIFLTFFSINNVLEASSSRKKKKKKSSARVAASSKAPSHFFKTESGEVVDFRKVFPGKVYASYSSEPKIKRIQQASGVSQRFGNRLLASDFVLTDFSATIGHGLSASQDLKKGSYIPYPGKIIEKNKVKRTEALLGSFCLGVYDSYGRIDHEKVYNPEGEANASLLFQHAPQNVNQVFRLAKSLDPRMVQESNAALSETYLVFLQKDVKEGQLLCFDYGPEYWRKIRIVPSLFNTFDRSVISDELSKLRTIFLDFKIGDGGGLRLSLNPIDLMLKIIYNSPLKIAAVLPNGEDKICSFDRNDMIRAILAKYSEKEPLSRIFSDVFYNRYLTGKDFPTSERDKALQLISLPYDLKEVKEAMRVSDFYFSSFGLDESTFLTTREILKRRMKSSVKEFWD